MIDSSQRFDDLRARYAGSLKRKQQALAVAWRELAAAPGEDHLRRELQLQIHRLAGSALAYGYERIGESARAADIVLHDWDVQAPSLRGAPHELIDRLDAPVHTLLGDLDAAIRDEAQRAPADSNLRVLLIEDDPGQAVLIGAQLEARGCVVRIERGTDALWQALALWPCHAVVLDYWLRGETAAEIAAMLRRESQFAHVALVCFSIERDEQVLRAALDAGCDAALGKAEGPDRLLAVVRECVARPDRSGKTLG
ncbi:response regulator [Dokdonella sp.]|uniref:response regulator n=1 Tax=Dokdonella sp. TaxID=2291710 RepID=UPI001B15779F|nr:response regulator [Dokdonella sp.]MBO9661429.1 response regulator [Dokdonella sp.]